MQLVVSSQPGLIGIQTTPGQFHIESTPARLDIKQETGKVQVQTRAPKLEIDQYEARAQLGFKKYSDITKEAAAAAVQRVLEFIAQKTSEGNQLKAIEKGGNAIREIAMEKAWPQKQRQEGYTPVVGPKFHATPAEIRFTPPEAKGPIIGYSAEFIPGQLNVNYNRGGVNIYMRQYPEITIDVKV